MNQLSHHRRPGVFLTADWRYLSMVNFEIAPELLVAWLPEGTESDEFQGKTLVTLFGMRFCNTRVLRIPVPFHRDFSEVNLRFYVRRVTAGGVRPGIVVIKEIVPLRAVAWVARTLFQENFEAHPMRHQIDSNENGVTAKYEWCRERQWSGLTVRAAGEAREPAAGSVEEFVTERYFGYTRLPNGGTAEFEVQRSPWRIWCATEACLHGDMTATYGETFAEVLSATYHSAWIADGSPAAAHRSVVVVPGKPVRRGT